MRSAFLAPHSHEADGASPVWVMLCFNLSCPVLTRLRCVSKCQLWSCLTDFFDGIGINSISLQGVSSHLLVHAPFVHVVLLFPATSLMMHRACSKKGCRDPGAVVVTMVCSVCWSSASARRASARHCLIRSISGGVIPVSTGSMTVGVRCILTPGGGCCLVLRQVGVCRHCGTKLANNTRPEQKQVRLLIFEERQSVLPILCRPVVEVSCTVH